MQSASQKAGQPGHQRREHRAQNGDDADDNDEGDNALVHFLDLDVARQNTLDIEQGKAERRRHEAGLHNNRYSSFVLWVLGRQTCSHFTLEVYLFLLIGITFFEPRALLVVFLQAIITKSPETIEISELFVAKSSQTEQN